MKIAVAANSQDSNAQVAMQAARATFYLIYEDGELLDVVPNPYSTIDRGAARWASELLQQQGVELLVAGEFGSRFVELLEEININTMTGSGAVSKMVQELPV